MNENKTTENNPERTILTLHEIKKLTDAFQLIIAKLGTITCTLSDNHQQSRLYKKACQYREELEQLEESLKPTVFL